VFNMLTQLIKLTFCPAIGYAFEGQTVTCLHRVLSSQNHRPLCP
jgi:hypothetical protein